MKIKEFQKELRNKKIDFAFFYNLDSASFDPTMTYFSGYTGYGLMIIPAKTRPFLIVPKMEIARAQSQGFSLYKWDKKDLFKQIKQLLKIKAGKAKAKTVGIDATMFSVAMQKKLRKNLKPKFKDVSRIMSHLREIKTKKEIENIRKACRITDNIFSGIIKNFKRFRTESDIAAYIEFEAKKRGCDMAFKPIVASGGNSAMPHYEPSNIKLKKGFCVMDFGVKYKNYCSDMTRTIFVGKPAKKDIEIYSFMKDVQEQLLAEVKVGKRCKTLYESATKKLGKFSKNFTHGLGHGFGIEIHESPNLSENIKQKLKPGMVFTIEPGIYFPKKLGIRIEDDVLVTKNKVEVLTRSSKELVVKK
jgi:Xaa-Pro aminopeptidase